jgi:PAS domain S-box-containing protein
MDEAFYALDADWRFIYVNGGAERFWKRHRRELLGRSMLEVFPAFPGSESHAAHVRALKSGQRLRVETISTATRTPVELNLQPTSWGLTVYFRDISDRRRIERELRAREALLTLAERTAGIGVWELDLGTNEIRGTPQFFRIMGLPPDTAILSPSAVDELRHPDDSEAPDQRLIRAIGTGEEDYEVDYRIKRSDGETRWIYGRGKVLRDEAGQPIRCAGVSIDITDLKASAETAERLAAIVQSSDDAIVGKNLQGIIHSWNAGATRLFGYQPDEIVGQSITTLIPADRIHEEAEIIRRITRGERIQSYETVRRRRDGTFVDVAITVSPIRDRAGKVVGASKIARDITDRRRVEEQQKLFLREMHHRINNLFALTSSIITMSARSAGSTEELASLIRGRLKALSQAQEITMRSLGAEQGSEQQAALRELVETILAPFADADSGRIDISGPPIHVGERSFASLALVLHELATNSAKYGSLSRPGGRLLVSWWAEEDLVQLRWEEHGGPGLASPPRGSGFGTRLLKTVVEGQLAGTASHDWLEDGLRLTLALPLETLRI